MSKEYRICFRLEEEENDFLRLEADQMGLSISEYCRKFVREGIYKKSNERKNGS